MQDLQWRFESRQSSWALVVDGVAGDIQLNVSSSEVALLHDGQRLLTVPVPSHLSAAQSEKARAKRTAKGQLIVLWPQTDATTQSESNDAVGCTVEKGRKESKVHCNVSLEEKLRKLREERCAFEAKFELMHSLYAQMNALARERLMPECETAESQATLEVEEPEPEACSSEASPESAVIVETDEVMGRCLVATRDFRAGDILFSERPCITFPLRCHAPGEKEDLVATLQGLSSQQLAFLRTYEAHLEATTPEEHRKLWLPEEEVSGFRASGLDIQCDSLLHLQSVAAVNAHHYGLGSALFRTITMMEHSCAPNCRIVETGGLFDVEALQDIKSGERLNISYIGDEALLFADTAARRRYLAKGHLFSCACRRCSGPDQARRFLCSECNSSDVLAIAAEDDAGATTVAPWRCDGCGAQPPRSHVEEMLKREQEALAEWRAVREELGRSAEKLAAPEEFLGLWLNEVKCRTDLGHEGADTSCARLRRRLAGLRGRFLVVAPRHWLAAHTVLLDSLLALGEIVRGRPVNLEEEVARGVAAFVQLSARLAPEADHILQRMIDEMRSLLRDASAGRLWGRLSLFFTGDGEEMVRPAANSAVGESALCLTDLD